jgi:peptidyl-prolyl cis-trans isomerase NIMA-interacting 1
MSIRRAALLVVASSALGCGSIASSPSWVGGGVAVDAPIRAAAEEEAAAKERERLIREPKEIGAKHILVMHKESTSRPDKVTRSRGEAYTRAVECLKKIRGGAPFDDMAKEYTDEPGGAERLGDLGVFDRGTMVKPFSDVAFTLKVGEVSEIVETKFGFHIIKRTE